MKKIIATGIALAISMSAHADEVSGTEDLPIVTKQWSDDWAKEKKRKIERLEDQHAHLGELERLAVPIGRHGGATREELLPYRFSDTTKLQSMLHEPMMPMLRASVLKSQAGLTSPKGMLTMHFMLLLPMKRWQCSNRR